MSTPSDPLLGGLATLRAQIAAAAAQLDQLENLATEQRGGDRLVPLAEGFGPLSGSTLMRWARLGRLVAFRADRGRLLAWERDVRAAVEGDQYTAPNPKDGTEDPFADCAEETEP